MRKKIRNLLVFSFVTVAGAGVFSLAATNQAAAATDAPYDYALAYREYTIENYSQYVTVKDPLGATVETDDGVFTPLREGDYTIRENGTIKILRVFATIPKTTYNYEFSFENQYKTGEIIDLPKATVSSAVKGNIAYDIFVEYEGKIIDVLSKNEQATYQFAQSGDYAMVYTYEDIFGYISTSANYFEVVDSPVIAYDAPETISLGRKISVETIYAYNGTEKVEATLEITSPSAKTVDISEGSFIAEEVGTYSYVVTAQIGGQTLMEQYDVECEVFTADLFEATTFAKEPVSEFELPEICLHDGNGVLLQAEQANAKFTFANVIDLNTLTRDQNLLTFFPYRTEDIGHVLNLRVVLTDIYDKDNSVGIQFKCSPFHDNLTYVTAYRGARHYAYDNANWIYTGVNGPVLIGDEHFFAGLMRNHYSMQMLNPEGGLELYSFTLDYANRDMVLDLTSENLGRMTLMDFDNPVWCGGEDYVWDGFTTGEVYMTVEFGVQCINARCANTAGKGGAIIVTEAAGQDVSGKVINDTVAPSITLDLETEYKTNMPYGLVGEAYALPNVRANDVVSGSVGVDVNISVDGEPVSYEGGEFVPSKAGEYTVEYVATDLKGNVGRERLTFTVYADVPPISIDTVAYTAPVTGEYFKIPEIQVEGMSGKTNVTTEVVYNGNVVVPDAAGKIFVDKVGEIKLKVSVVDWLGQEKKETLTIPVSVENMRIVVEDRYGSVQKGRTLAFGDAVVYDFNGKGNNPVEQKIYVNDTLLNGNTYTVANSDSVLNIRYEVSCAGKTAEYSYAAPVFSGVESLFVTDGAYSVGGKFNDEVHFTFTQDGSFALVNAVSHNFLKLSFATPTYAFNYMDVYLTDAANPNVSVFLRISEYDRSKVRVQLNGTGDYYLLSGSLSAGVPFTFFYESERLVFKQDVDQKIIFNVNECVNGDVFKGFNSEAVYVKVNVVGVSSSSTVRLVAVSNETFVTYLRTGRDTSRPEISVPLDKEVVDGRYGEFYTVTPTKAYDVIQGAFDVYVTVQAPGGSVLLEKQLLTDSFTFEQNKYGRYTITYETFDNQFIGKTVKTVFIDVKDEVPPTITLKGELITEATLGDTFTILGATATDNVDTEVTVKILIYDPQYRNSVVQENGLYRFTYKGTYKIVYLATDVAGNQTREIYYIEVK